MDSATCDIIHYLTQHCTLKLRYLIHQFSQQCSLKIHYLAQHHALVIQYSLIKKSIAPRPNSKSWGKNTVIHSAGNYVSNVLKYAKKSIKVVTNSIYSGTKNSVL